VVRAGSGWDASLSVEAGGHATSGFVNQGITRDCLFERENHGSGSNCLFYFLGYAIVGI
jgi:hypothetical protein